MIVLPRGKPVKEGGRTLGMDWHEVLEKLHDGHFTGYLNFVADYGRGLLLFVRGQLVVIRYCMRDDVLAGEVALKHIFSASLSGHASLDIYRLEPVLALEIFNLIEGETLYQGQHRDLLDIPFLLERLKSDCFSGGLHVQAGDEVAIILMEEGHFLGFFHDGHPGIMTSADLSTSVAWQPGAKIDVIRSAGVTDLDLPDFFQELDLGPLWENALLHAG
ncbi:MAG: hypothetical protein AB7D06_12300 [Pedobacter sp.]